MSKAVLISINPKWCELIASGKKTVEVRKTRPKLETPFKCYIYCTLPSRSELFRHGCIVEYANELIRLQSGKIVYGYGMRLCCDEEHRPYSKDNFLCRKVIGEFVCDSILDIRISCSDPNMKGYPFPGTGLTDREIMDYLGNGKTGYAWHISDLVIYDKPKELNEFRYNEEVVWRRVSGKSWITKADMDRGLKRPPQSWCYVEDLEG